MVDDGENSNGKIASLDEQRARADEAAIEGLQQLIDEGSRASFRDQLGEIRENTCGPWFEGPGMLPAVAAGALGVMPRDFSRIDLPATYKAAVLALRQCDQIDECGMWANKAHALAAYARQVREAELYRLAKRIHVRAIRRAGELLREFKAQRGRRTDLELREGGHPKSTRAEAAGVAGLSEHQRKTALSLAAVGAVEFEQAVEGERLPTLTALAARGRAARPRSRWRPPERETVYVRTEVRYAPQGTLEEIAVERELAVLMASWRDASAEARRRFLQALGYKAE